MDSFLVEYVSDRINELEVIATPITSGDLSGLLTEGDDNISFRMMVSTLTAELLGKTIPPDNKKGFLQAVVARLRSSPSAFDGDLLGPLDDADSRLAFLELLASEVAANRLMEYRRYAVQQDASLEDHLTAEDAATMLLRSAGSSAKSDSNIIVELVDNTLKSPDFKILNDPVVNRACLNPPQLELIAQAFNAMRDEHQLRRLVLIDRCQVTLGTFCDTSEATVDKSALRNLSRSAILRLSAEPLVAMDHIFRFPRLEILAAFEKVSSKVTPFKLRNVRIQEVPDRGGRVNTFNFDGKIEAAKSKAEADLRNKSTHASKDKDRARDDLARDASRGRGLASHGAGVSDRGRGSGGNWNRGGRGAKQL